MSDLLPVQRDLARLLFSLPEAAGYALAGGAALVVQQIVDRDDDTVELDLAVDSPFLETPTAIDGIPVLTPLDLAARKVLTIVDRLEARDYTDLHTLAHLVGQQTCIDSALTMDAGRSVGAIAEAFERIDRIADDRYPERATDAATTRRYAVWTWNESRASAGMPSVPSSSFTRGSRFSYIACTTTRVATPNRCAASAGRSTSGSVIARPLRRSPTYRGAYG